MILKFACKLKKLLNLQTLIISNYSKSAMSKKALVFLAPGAEEMEFVIAVDILRRGGIHVTVAGMPDETPVVCSRGVIIIPDIGIADASSKGPYDAIVLPGGMGGSQALSESKEVGKLLKEQESVGKIIAAICAAPIALKTHKIASGKNITSYPSMKDTICEDTDFIYQERDVVVDGNITTSRGPATAYDFALNLVEQLQGKQKALEVAGGLLWPYKPNDVDNKSDDYLSIDSDDKQ